MNMVQDRPKCCLLVLLPVLCCSRNHQSGPRWRGWAQFTLYALAYLIAGGDIVLQASKNIIRGQVFDEYFLMSVATLGAFAIGEYPEGVAVMLFYQLGELFRGMAVNRSRKSIQSLMDIRPDYANILTGSGDETRRVSPEDVRIGDRIVVKQGRQYHWMVSFKLERSMVDTSALTGESVPRELESEVMYYEWICEQKWYVDD
ncbi:hypothetical protein [Paenibacillus sp. M2]|uniref:P-type ATPase n=1 Tax=Paenibacillus sp. M2 TaxID=3341793 RepID=UPI00398968CD